jgi:hypothetical protein
VPTGWKRGKPIVSLLYPECEIQIIKTDASAGTLTTTIKDARAGDTIRGRISAFIDIARREKAAVMVICDTEAKTEIMVKLMRQAMPEMRRTCPQAFPTAKEFGKGLRDGLVQIMSHDTDPDFGLKYAMYRATGFAA